jgi:hypothetical protein
MDGTAPPRRRLRVSTPSFCAGEAIMCGPGFPANAYLSLPPFFCAGEAIMDWHVFLPTFAHRRQIPLFGWEGNNGWACPPALQAPTYLKPHYLGWGGNKWVILPHPAGTHLCGTRFLAFTRRAPSHVPFLRPSPHPGTMSPASTTTMLPATSLRVPSTSEPRRQRGPRPLRMRGNFRVLEHKGKP